MQTVHAIIEKFDGFAWFKHAPIRIENGIHMPLVIEYPGKTGFMNSDYFRVMQLETVDGKLVPDIAVYFECNPDGTFWRAVVWHCEVDGENRFVYTPSPLDETRSAHSGHDESRRISSGGRIRKRVRVGILDELSAGAG